MRSSKNSAMASIVSKERPFFPSVFLFFFVSPGVSEIFSAAVSGRSVYAPLPGFWQAGGRRRRVFFRSPPKTASRGESFLFLFDLVRAVTRDDGDDFFFGQLPECVPVGEDRAEIAEDHRIEFFTREDFSPVSGKKFQISDGFLILKPGAEFQRAGIDIVGNVPGGEGRQMACQRSRAAGQFAAGFLRIQIRCDMSF